MRIFSLRTVMVLAIAVGFSASTARTATAQCEIAPCEIDVYTGLWIPFLPDYQAGSIVSGGTVIRPNVFDDDQTDVGVQFGVKGMHRFPPTRTLFEFDLNIAGIDSLGSRETIADPGPTQTVWMANLQGTGFLATPDGTSVTFSLDSDVLHYSEYIGLRDRFNLTDYGLGMFDVGFGFSHMAFEQDYSLFGAPLNGGFSGQYVEDLDTNFIGGEIRSTINKRIRGRLVKLDVNIGIYDMDGEYDGVSYFRDGAGVVVNQSRVVDELKKTAATVDVGLRVDSCFRGVLMRPGINFKYFSDLVAIEHPQTNVPSNPASLTTDDAYVLGLSLEFKL